MKIKDDPFLRSSSIIFIAIIVGNFFNYLFHIYMGRVLGPIDYGTLGSLLAISYIIYAPARIIQTTIAKFVSGFKAKNEFDSVASLMFGAIKKLSLYGFICFILIFIFSSYIASFLNINSIIPIMILGLAFSIAFIYPVNMGVLRGLQKFKTFALMQSSSMTLKFIFGVSLVLLGFGVNGALFACFLAPLVIFLFTFIPLKFLFGRKKVRVEGVYKYSLPVIFALSFTMLISNIDVVLVKHFFNAEDAGFYAAGATIAKIVIFASNAFTIVFFPKVSELHSKGKNTAPILRKCIFYVSATSSLLVLFYFISPYFIVNMLFGSEYTETIHLVGLFGLAMAFFSLINVIINYNLAIENFKFIYLLVFFGILEIFLMFLFHSSLMEILKILTLTMAFLFFGLVLLNKKYFLR